MSRQTLDLFAPLTQSWIGTDEAGKGDYFGPLVVAGFLNYPGLSLKLQQIKVRDSKKIADSIILSLSQELKNVSRCSVVTIGPSKYNELFTKMKNLNRILAWGHARAIEDILKKVECTRVVSDKFGDEGYIKRALMEKGKRVQLIQRTKAEDDLAVAAASILARAEFLRRLKKLSEEIGIELPKGASEKVDQVARQIVLHKGKEVLSQVAKLHFKNSQRVLCTRNS